MKKEGMSSAVQTERRRLLIDATLTAIAEHGLSRVTLAKISAVAGLTAGSMNFHFSSKEALLLETLYYLAQEFDQTIEQALTDAAPDPAAQLLALFDASLDPELTESRKLAVWHAFIAESRGREDYQRICGAQDKQIFAITLKLCDELIHAGGKQDYMNTRAMANSVQGLIEEISSEIFHAGENYDREDARYMYLSFLASVFPWAYKPPQSPTAGGPKLSSDDNSLRIVQAGSGEVKAVSELFDLYRQFYDQPADAKLARKFIGDNIRKERSTIYLAQDQTGRAIGFVQLYPGWCSVAAAPLWTLYDLYVDESARGLGVGRALMLRAEELARKTKACRIDLETAVNNHNAQGLYEDLGYERERAFYKYSLELGQA